MKIFVFRPTSWGRGYLVTGYFRQGGRIFTGIESVYSDYRLHGNLSAVGEFLDHAIIGIQAVNQEGGLFCGVGTRSFPEYRVVIQHSKNKVVFRWSD